MSDPRPLEIASFLDLNHWNDASIQPFAADFSPRRYARLTQPSGSTAILMDADPDQKTPQFVALAKILRSKGISAPEIIAAAPERGLVLMQDLGTQNIGTMLDSGTPARPFFLRAAATLAKLHRNFDRSEALNLDLPLYTAAFLTEQAELFLDAYLPFACQREATDTERRDFRAAWLAVLRPLETMPKSLLLRDFMPDNLMDCTGGDLGVLDFQDAGIGPIAYDLASLCEEVRRDGGFALLPDVIAAYRDLTQTPIPATELLRACTLLSAQRHTRILGIIARLALKSGRRDKLAFLPRIKNHLAHLLAEPYLLPVREELESAKVF